MKKQTVRHILYFSLFLLSISNSYSQSIQDLDSIPTYGKEEYESIRLSLQKDTIYMKLFEEKAIAGDTNAVKLLEILQTPYESRHTISGLTNEDINAAIFAFHISKQILEKFKALDESLKELNSDTEIKSDSLLREMKKRMEELDLEK